MKKSEIIDSVMKSSVELKCISKVAFDKFAAYPSIFLQLDTDIKRQISSQYEIGPGSEVKEISIDQVTKKPFTEQLLVYTISTLTEKEQQNARKELYSAIDDFERNNVEYQKLKGSIAGNEILEKAKEKIKIDVDKKYTPTEKVVAWGIGVYFGVNRKLFQYYYGRGARRSTSDEPKNRKDLISYIKEAYGGKVYVISKDPSIAEKRTDRQKNKDYTDPKIKVLKDRAKTLGEKKIVELDKVFDDYVKIIKLNLVHAAENYLIPIMEKVKKGEAYSVNDFVYKFNFLNRIAEAYRNVKGSSNPINEYGDFDRSKQSLLEYSKMLDDTIAKVKKIVDDSKATE